MKPKTRFLAASIQDIPVYHDIEGALAKSIQLIGKAADLGARLVVFPELWVPGYPFWYWRISDEHNPALGKTYVQSVENSVRVPGPFTDALCKAARTHNATVVMGIQELAGTATLYNSQIFIGGDGRILGVHRKLVPTFAERMVWAQGNGSTMRVHDTDIGALGGLICWEHFMPLARYAMYAMGMQVSASCWPASKTGKSHLASQFMAVEGRCFVLHSGSFIPRDALPPDIPIIAHLDLPEVIYHGGSAIIGPDGDYLTPVEYETQAIQVAEIDLDRTIELRQTLDVTGHYARPEVFKLQMNRTDFSPFEDLRSEG